MRSKNLLHQLVKLFSAISSECKQDVQYLLSHQYLHRRSSESQICDSHQFVVSHTLMPVKLSVIIQK